MDLHTEERLFAGIQSKGLLVFIVKPNFWGCSICIAKLGIRIVYSTVAGCIWKVPISQRRVKADWQNANAQKSIPRNQFRQPV